jgi:hypothetical protein
MDGSINGETLARHTAQAIGVRDFLERWNTGEGSLISDMNDLDMAFSFDELVDRTWGIALIEAQTCGIHEQFHVAFGALVQPMIDETFASGLKNLCTNWARKTASASPARHGLTAPFDEVSEWISWCLSHVEWPPFARPWGEELMPEKQEEQLIRHALAQESELAIAHGWISGAPQATSHTSWH